MTREEFKTVVAQYGASLMAIVELANAGNYYAQQEAAGHAKTYLDAVMAEWDRLHVAAQAHSADRDAGS